MGGGVEIKWGDELHKFSQLGGSLLNAIGGEHFEKMQFDLPPPPPPLQLGTKEYGYKFYAYYVYSIKRVISFKYQCKNCK